MKVEQQYRELLLGATAVGLALGLGFVVGRVSAGKTARAACTEADILDRLSEKEEAYNKVQSELKLTYYKDLLSQPKTTSSESAPEAVASQELDSAPKPNVVTTEKPSSERMAKALANVLGDEAPVLLKEAIKSSLPTSTGSPFAIQIASLPDRRSAEEIAKKLMRDKGIKAKLVEADVAGKGIVYRVRIHGFKTREEADNFRQKNGLSGITVAQ